MVNRLIDACRSNRTIKRREANGVAHSVGREDPGIMTSALVDEESKMSCASGTFL